MNIRRHQLHRLSILNVKGSVNDIVILLADLVISRWRGCPGFAGLSTRPHSPGCPWPIARRSKPAASLFQLAGLSPAPPCRDRPCVVASEPPRPNLTV